MEVNALKSVKVPLEVMLGSTELTVVDLSKIGEGTIVKLDSFAGEPVQVIAAGRVIAFGEVVVIEENFGVRVTQVLEDGE